MSIFYIKSKINDRTCLDTEATSMLRDILVIYGIFDDFKKRTNDINIYNFGAHYKQIISQKSSRAQCSFVGELHYCNCGIKALRSRAERQNIATSGIKIKKLCQTRRNHQIKLPLNTSKLLYILFELLYDNQILSTIFEMELLKKCTQYTPEIRNYPNDCSYNILGFISLFVNNIQMLNYSKRHKKFAASIITAITNIVKKYEIKDSCGKRILEGGKNDEI